MGEEVPKFCPIAGASCREDRCMFWASEQEISHKAGCVLRSLADRLTIAFDEGVLHLASVRLKQ